jgi:putative heme-binding domain-containing protein
MLESKLPRSLLPLVTESLRRFAKDNPDDAKLLSDVMKGGLLVSTSPQEVIRIAELVKTKGNAKRGRALYLNNKALACINCHRLEGVGGSVGPDLTRVWETHSLEKVMEAILDPSKEIKEGYQAYRAVTTSGQVVTGLKVAQNDKEVVLRDATGKEVRIASKDLDELSASKKSLMPDDVVTHLNFDEFIDLIAFLRDRQAQEALRGLALEFFVAGPVPADVKLDAGLAKLPGPPAPLTIEDKKYSWDLKYADPSGRLALNHTAGNGNTAAFALTHVFSPTEQKVRLGVGGAGVQVWINDRKAHDEASPESAEVQHEVTLRAGWNVVLVRVAARPDAGFSLRFIGGEGLRLSPLRQGDIK